ncbi:LOW QUALITY PROTEIN: Lipoamide acyltransferase component of branched-chain alpha-keto acid dehydrogenase complex [Picochlorum sp. SENEW3]|nr:LOW QUALITY PROTEIN: Lipoamide acyltransferase component of branched-chain alpha-keto acid dehydrogenase complex [Picochlorum sp. SENEW3]
MKQKNMYQMGFHSSPSLSQLHMHVISKDFDSECLKTKKHWTAFTNPQFFLNVDDVLAQFERGIPALDYNVEEKNALLRNTPLTCPVCHALELDGRYSSLLTQNLAQTGEGIKECEVVQWFVKPGDTVKEYDMLCRVQSDKATVDVTSIFRVSCPEGGLVAVGQPLVEYYGDDTHRIPLRGYQRAMVKSMEISATIPHCYAFDTLALPRSIPKPITAHAMQAKFVQNADSIEIPGEVHVGIAIDTPQGLAVPCIHSAQDKSVEDIGQEIQLLKQKAINRQLPSRTLREAPSPLAILAHSAGLACIQPGQCSIVTLGKITDDGSKKSMDVSVAADHRLVDGSIVASFLSKFSTNICKMWS